MSTDIQLKGDSRVRQLKLSKDYAENNNLELVETIQDIGVSAFKGLNVKEGALGAFLQACQDHLIEGGSYLLVESLDRISRENPYDAFIKFTGIINLGVTIVTLSDNQKYTRDSLSGNYNQILIALMSMSRANEESEIKSQRLSAAWIRKRENVNNKKITSKCPSWLKYDKAKDIFLVVEKNAKVVENIFSLNADGFGKLAIAKMFNQQNIPSLSNRRNTSKKWNPSYIDKILKNRSVLGEFQPHKMQNGKRVREGEAIQNYFPQVIKEDIFYSAQKIRSDRRNKGGNKQSNNCRNIFHGLVKCSSCGSNIAFRNKGASPKGGLYLICSSSIHAKGCDAPSWKYNEFESYFFKFINDVDFNEIFRPQERSKSIQNLKIKIDAAEQTIKENEKKKNKLVNELSEFEGKEILLTLRNKIESLQSEINVISESKKDNEDELSVLSQDFNSLKHDITNVIKELSDLDDENEVINARLKINALLKSSIEHITLINENVLRSNTNGSKVFVEQWESRDLLSDRALKELSDKNIITDKQLDKYMMMDKGQRFYDFSTRSFIVQFKYGYSKLVIPYSDFLVKSPVFKK